jgi:hypothetical protein
MVHRLGEGRLGMATVGQRPITIVIFSLYIPRPRMACNETMMRSYLVAMKEKDRLG